MMSEAKVRELFTNIKRLVENAGDFSNDNTHNGYDEGNVRGWEMWDGYMKEAEVLGLIDTVITADDDPRVEKMDNEKLKTAIVDPRALDAIVNLGSDEEMTVREYLQELLYDLWWQGEGFNSKRPFGNSGWQIDVTHALVLGGFVEGEIIAEEDGYICVESHDYEAAHRYISELIKEHLFAK